MVYSNNYITAIQMQIEKALLQSGPQNISKDLTISQNIVFSAICKDLKIETNNTLNISDMKEILKKLSKITLMTAYLSFEPTQFQMDVLIEQLSKFDEKNNYKIKFICDTDIVAGIVLEISGRRFDYSYADKLVLN